MTHRLPGDVMWETDTDNGDYSRVWAEDEFYEDLRVILIDRIRASESDGERQYLRKLVLYVEYRSVRECQRGCQSYN